MQSQLLCSGCRTLLLYPRGEPNVRCVICNTITSAAPPPGLDVAQLVCGGCRTLLVYSRGAPRVQCSCCNTINLARTVAHINCGQCHTLLMYPYGAPSVKCAICQFVTNVGMNNMRLPIPMQRTNGNTFAPPSTSAPMTHAQNQTVVVENPMSMDESGKLVSNVVVGVTTEKK